MSARGRVVWLTGRPASGKSTIAEALMGALKARGEAAVWLDSDALREVLTPEPTYSEAEREEFYEALAAMAAHEARKPVTVVVSATAHRRAWRDRARAGVHEFVEVWVRCDEAVLRARDPKGLYARAQAGEISGLPGVDIAYEEPTAPEVVVDGAVESAQSAATRILEALAR